jgi:hypothetical protein
MNAPYSTVNNMAARICGMKPAPLTQPNPQTEVSGSGYYKYQYTGSSGLVIDCLLEYEAAHDGGTGPNSEESWPESINLVYALVNGVDISCAMCDEVKVTIEGEALESMEMDKWNSDYDRAADRAESNLEAA